MRGAEASTFSVRTMGEVTMSNPLDPVRISFDKAVGPYRKRYKLMADLKEADVGKERRAQLVKEAAQLEAEWVEALVGLWKAMDECSVLREKKDA
jgi:hypothetical protein